MKILIISTSVVPLGSDKYGGIEKLCLDFINFLSEEHHVTVAAPKGSRVPLGQANLIETIDVQENQDRDDLAFLVIEGKVDLTSFDIIHDFSHKHEIAKHYHKDLLPTINMLWDPVVMKYEKAPYNVVGLSHWQSDRFLVKYSQECKVMPLIVDTDLFKPVDNPENARLLFLGKISPEKGVHLAVKYAAAAGWGIDVVGGLIPSEQKSKYVQEISELCDRTPDANFHFNVTEAEKIKYLQNAAAIIYPVQQEEAHWLVGVEAWACGTPSVMFATGAMPEITTPWIGTLIKDEVGFIKVLKGKVWSQDREVIRAHALLTYSTKMVIKEWVLLYQKVRDGARWTRV